MSNPKIRLRVIVILILFSAGRFISICSADEQVGTGIVLADDQGKIVYGQNREKPFIPASILKLLTSLAAIEILGQDYHFTTLYSFDQASKNLYIKGLGDPLFVSEVIETLCREIVLKTGPTQIHHILLDSTYFSGHIRIPGNGSSLNPYDASVGALCANFNTLAFKWQSKEGRFISDEPQTPLLPVFHDDIQKTGLKQGRIVLSQQQSLLYPGLLIKHGLEKHHISITGSVLQGTLDIQKQGVHTFVSPFDLKAVVQKLLKFSNNFMANQLLLTIGAVTYGPPATLEKGIKAIQIFSEQQLNLPLLTLSEGSGLSRKTLISPDQMLKVLMGFMPFYAVLNNKGNDFFKTGTLTDVRTRAGYILGQDNRLYPYVIMMNGKTIDYTFIRKSLLNRVSQITTQ
ncbi:D-alanyl-D-alanine carboxypeptidase [Desulfobacula sp.]|uniref:D-alanyl-D-alanine carboxypeptidase/D-alanyl-D-alanine-endopeptidase n=1 Tax=Desulfobacula sp. TaxID=2593537 RepID=UPI00262AA08B|nr:D-alanyl-D-alanine carboxypeptidase [Desulfobacula sp.]